MPRLSWLLVTAVSLTLALAPGSARADEPVQDGKTLSQWVKLLKAKDGEERSMATTAIGQIGKEAKSAIPALVEAVKDKEWTVRCNAAKALGLIVVDLEVPASEVKTVVAALVPALKDPEYIVRSNTAVAFGDMGRELKGEGPEVKVMVAAMIAALKDDKFQDFNNAARSELISNLGRIARESEMQTKVIVPALVPFLKDKDPGVRKGAVEAIGDCEDKAKSSFSVVLPLLKDSDGEVRKAAAAALLKLDEAAAKKAGVRER